MSKRNERVALPDNGFGLVVHSPKYGPKLIEIDADDYDLINDRCWYVSRERNTFYARAKTRPAYRWSTTTLHRILLPEAIEIDHIDRNGLNNRRANLRPVTAGENQRNRRRQANNTSGYRGVFFDRGSWRAQIRVGRRTHLPWPIRVRGRRRPRIR